MECERVKKILLTFETGNSVNLVDAKFCILYSLNHKSITYRFLITLLDLLEKLSISSEFVCVKIISYIVESVFDIALIFLGCTCRFLSTPNFYVNISENTVVHILVYICMQLSSKISSKNMNLVFSLFLSIGSDISFPAYKFITDQKERNNVKETVEEFLIRSNIYPIEEDVRVYLDQINLQDLTSSFSEILILCIRSHSHQSLKHILTDKKISIDKLYEYVNVACDTYNWKAFKKIFESIDLGFEPNYTLNYCLINKILYMMNYCTQTDTRGCEILKNMLHILCSRGTFFDQTQWSLLSQLGYDKELMNAHYSQRSAMSTGSESIGSESIGSETLISNSLRKLCIKLGISPTLDKERIYDRLQKYDLKQIKKYSTVRIPDNVYKFDTVDCVSYTDSDDINKKSLTWYFTSTNIESILSTKINPYTGNELPSNFLEQLMIYRTINRRLSLLKYQYNHESNSQELISSTRSVFCTRTIMQTAKLFGIKEEDILNLTTTSTSILCNLLDKFSVRTDIIFPISEDDKTLVLAGITNLERNSHSTNLSNIQDCTDEGKNIDTGHMLNTFCQLAYDMIHCDLKMAKLFFANIIKLGN